MEEQLSTPFHDPVIRRNHNALIHTAVVMQLIVLGRRTCSSRQITQATHSAAGTPGPRFESTLYPAGPLRIAAEPRSRAQMPRDQSAPSAKALSHRLLKWSECLIPECVERVRPIPWFGVCLSKNFASFAIAFRSLSSAISVVAGGRWAAVRFCVRWSCRLLLLAWFRAASGKEAEESHDEG